MKITKLETFLVKPPLALSQDAYRRGLVGLGEPILEGRAKTCAQAVAELEPYLIGKDPTRVVHHWQAMYRHAFYRGGPILTSALSGVSRRCGDLRVRPWAYRCTSCWAVRRETGSACTRAGATRQPSRTGSRRVSPASRPTLLRAAGPDHREQGLRRYGGQPFCPAPRNRRPGNRPGQ